MLVVGVTGGIGSGKSTFARLLGDRGAVVLDADTIGHEEIAPGKPAWHSIREVFGDEVLDVTLAIDRKRLAAIVFADKEKLAALNTIVHPRILARIADELDALRATDTVVVVDAALLVETGLVSIADVVVVVTAPKDVRIERVVKQRRATREDAAARIAAQATEAQLVDRADIVVRNDGSLDHLLSEADRVWRELLAWEA